MKCKHENVSRYEEGYRCITCFAAFVPVEPIALLIQDEFNDYAPELPPIHIRDFIDALLEVTREK